jgi:uncharacterized protein
MRLKRWFRSLEPRVLAEFDRPWLRWAKPWLDQHDVLAFNRRPLARGVAIGLFCGLIPGPLQVICTLLLCSIFRGNAIAGVATTFYTNPLTIIPLYIAAFHIGDRLLPGTYSLQPFSGVTDGAAFGSSAWITAVIDWMQALGWPLAVGLPAMGLWFALNGYWLVNYLWLRPVVARARRMRARRFS